MLSRSDILKIQSLTMYRMVQRSMIVTCVAKYLRSNRQKF